MFNKGKEGKEGGEYESGETTYLSRGKKEKKGVIMKVGEEERMEVRGDG